MLDTGPLRRRRGPAAAFGANADEPTGPPRSERRSGTESRELIMFAVLSLLVLLVVTAGALVAGVEVIRQEARRDGEDTADHLARLLVTPVADRIEAGDPAQTVRLAEELRTRIDAGVLHVAVVWRSDGSIAYSSEPLSGEPPAFGDGLLEAMAGRPRSEIVSDEHIGDHPDETMIEVYHPVPNPGGQPLVFEGYFPGDELADRMSTLSTQLGLVAVVPVLLVTAVQFPIAIRLVRRVSRHNRQRARMLEDMLSLSERERRSIAADLHDGVVQDLAGASYVLSGLSGTVPEKQRHLARAAENAVIGSVEQLRQLMLDINPPRLDDVGLRDAVRDVVERTSTKLPVQLDEGPLPDVGPEQAAALYRIALEGLRNVVRHAGATHAWLELGTTPDGRARIAVLDNGRGMSPSILDNPPEGHLGLPLLRDRVRDLGGTFTVRARRGGGTEIEAVLPPRDQAGPAIL